MGVLEEGGLGDGGKDVGPHGTRSNEVPESDNVFEQSKCVLST